MPSFDAANGIRINHSIILSGRNMSANTFKQMQERLNYHSVGFPETATGVEIKILKELFTEDEARLFLSLSHRLEKPESVAQRVDRPLPEVAEQLEDMAARGLLFRVKKGDSVRYAAIPFVHGLFEFQVSRLNRNLSELLEEYFQGGFLDAFNKSRGTFLRTIPVQKSLDATRNVAAFDDAMEILKKMNQIVVTDCICRKQKGLIDQSCDKPLETCFMFGAMGQYYLDNQMGRKIDINEAIQILSDAQAAGLVTQPATAQNPGGMCNCCGDCCGVLRALNQHPRPAELVFSNYIAMMEPESCVGCQSCIDRCQMNALTMNDQDRAEINPDRCIGCGLCVTTCPSGALRLELKTGDQFRVPPITGSDQMMAMAKERGLVA
jgi:Na+-translocating ferredoxin:NAD+ oxidoreductase subunit B